MKLIYLLLLLFSANVVKAHQPDLSSLMIYEQNGKYFLVIKSSLTAFEGEIDYHFGKNAYKNPEEFQQLVINHLKLNCFVIINGDSIKLNNPKVVLGHETTVFAELLSPINNFNSIYVKNTLFKDMPNNICEIILATRGLIQKQFILNNENKHEVKLKVENNNWVVVKDINYSFKSPILLFWVVLSLTLLVFVTLTVREKKHQI